MKVVICVFPKQLCYGVLFEGHVGEVVDMIGGRVAMCQLR
jgi:hypothetical protein